MTEPLAFTFADDGAIPNARLPLLVYRDAAPADAAGIERMFAANHLSPTTGRQPLAAGMARRRGGCRVGGLGHTAPRPAARPARRAGRAVSGR